MTHPTNDKNIYRIDRRTDEPWIIGMFAVCGLIASAFVLFVSSNPDAGRLASEIAQAEMAQIELPIAQSSPSPTDAALPAAGTVTRLAAGH